MRRRYRVSRAPAPYRPVGPLALDQRNTSNGNAALASRRPRQLLPWALSSRRRSPTGAAVGRIQHVGVNALPHVPGDSGPPVRPCRRRPQDRLTIAATAERLRRRDAARAGQDRSPAPVARTGPPARYQVFTAPDVTG